MTRRFLDLADAGADGLRDILAEAKRRKSDRAGWPKGRLDADRPLDGHALACVFEKPSTRTRLSFDMAMRQLGGQTLVMGTSDMQLGRGETVADTARVLSRMVDAVMVRANAHADVVELADNASIPVMNGLTDRSHPCQVVADLMTVEERLGRIAGTTWAWLGDGNNVAHSIVEAGSLLGFEVRVACPAGHGPARDVLDAARWRGGRTLLTESAEDAVAGADVVVTDTWISMGQDDSAAKIAAMQPYQVTDALMRLAAEKAMFLHCLPAHRGEEVVESVIDGPISAVWDEAENRLHAQKAILLWCLERI